MRKFVIKGETEEELKTELDKFLNKKLEAYFKSEPIPEINNESVRVVVGDTF